MGVPDQGFGSATNAGMTVAFLLRGAGLAACAPSGNFLATAYGIKTGRR